MASPQNIAVVYASLSGSTQRVAEFLVQHIQEVLPNAQVEMLDMLTANPEAFAQYEFIFIGASTYGEGDLNPFAEIFFASMTGREPEQMWKDLPFAIFALGDSSYLQFCEAAEHLMRFVPAHGGVHVEPVLRIDVLTQDWDQQTQMVSEWSDQFLKE